MKSSISESVPKAINMSAFRPRRAVPSAVNTPTEIHVKSTTGIKNSDAEIILSEFITSSEAVANAFPTSNVLEESENTGLSNATGNNAVLSQLKRVQRDLRGLPPIAAEPVQPSQNKKIKFDDIDADPVEEPLNKKIKFDDDEEEEEASDEEEKEEEIIEEEQVQEEQEEQDASEDEDVSEKKEKKHKKEKKEKKHKKEKKEKKNKD